MAEKEAALYLRRLCRSKVAKIDPIVDGLKHKQPLAVEMACSNPVSILTGPPGTGKTTTLKCIVDSFLEAGLRGVVFCPTGKAAKRADEVVNRGRNFINRIKCSTVHSGLVWSQGEFAYNRQNKLGFDFIIIDEYSMLDTYILRDLIEAIKPGVTRLLFCGDQYQLPSVGPGNVGRDLIASGKIPSVELDVVMRTGENSGITYNANMILKGKETSKIDPASGVNFNDYFFVPKTRELDTVNSILKYVFEDLPSKRNYDSMTDIQVMCPGKNGLVGTNNMNKAIRERLKIDTKNSLAGLSVGDKVINNSNDREFSIVNGDIGYVKEIVNGQTGRHAVIDFGPNTGKNNDGIVEMKSTKISDQIAHAYALTVHKLQGSETPVCILPIHSCHTMLLTRNLIYTGLTRGKQLAVLIGETEVFRRGVMNTITDRRQTKLAEYLAV